MLRVQGVQVKTRCPFCSLALPWAGGRVYQSQKDIMQVPVCFALPAVESVFAADKKFIFNELNFLKLKLPLYCNCKKCTQYNSDKGRK